jgi:hypothetical protein
VNIIEFIRDPKIVGGDLSPAQETALRLLYGLPLNDEQSQIAQAALCTEEVPQREYAEASYICGRRSGKSDRLAANVGLFEAVTGGHEKHLAPGERGHIVLIAQDKRAARVLYRYIYGKLQGSPLLSQLIENVTAEEIDLNNRLTISIFPASWKAPRGYSIPVALLDELAFFKVEGVNIDKEIIDSIRPAQATFPRSKLIKISSPYAKAGELYRDFANRQSNSNALVFKLPTWTMNPTVPQSFLDSERLRDPEMFDREYGANFSDSISNAFVREAVEACIVRDRRELPCIGNHVRYIAGVDPSGGGRDEFSLSICHKDKERKMIVQDVIRGWHSKNPQNVVGEVADILRRYHIRKVVGDKYSAEWVRAEFLKYGVIYETAENTASEAFLELLPAINAGTVELLDDKLQTGQLIALERTTGRSGKDTLGHPAGGHDDRANALAHCVAALSQRLPKAGAGLLIKANDQRFIGYGNDRWEGSSSGRPHPSVGFLGGPDIFRTRN